MIIYFGLFGMFVQIYFINIYKHTGSWACNAGCTNAAAECNAADVVISGNDNGCGVAQLSCGFENNAALRSTIPKEKKIKLFKEKKMKLANKQTKKKNTYGQ